MARNVLLCALAVICYSALCSAQGIELPALPADSVVCGPQSVNITISDAYLAQSEVRVSSVSRLSVVADNSSFAPLAADGCNVTRSDGDDGYVFRAGDEFRSCAGEEKLLSGTQREVTFYLRVHPPNGTSAISREPQVYIRATCTYNSQLEALSADVDPSDKQYKAVVAPIVQDFVVEGGFFTTGFASQLDTGNDVIYDVGDKINVAFWLDTDLSNSLVLQAHSCWVTQQNEDIFADPKYYIINNWCPVEDLLSVSASAVVKNWQDTWVQFSFDAFRWRSATADQKLFVHCQLHVCDPDIDGACTKTCSARRKRSVLSMEREQETKTISLPPVRVRDWAEMGAGEIPSDIEGINFPPARLRKCDAWIEHVMDCQYGCVTTMDGRSGCTCPVGWQLNRDRKTCSEIGNEVLVIIGEGVVYVKPTLTEWLGQVAPAIMCVSFVLAIVAVLATK